MPAPLIVPQTPSIAGIPLHEYRADIGDRLGMFWSVIVSTTATSGDTRRVVLSDDLRDDEDEQDRYAGTYLYVRDGNEAGTQTRVVRTGYEGPFGGLIVSRPFSAPLARGTTVELTSPLPVKRWQGSLGLNEIVNQGLERCRIEARIPFVGNGTYSFALEGYRWLTRYEQTNGIYDWYGLDTATQSPLRSGSSYGLRSMGGSRTLDTTFPYAEGETFQLAVLVSGKRLVRQNGIWGYSEAGLQNDDDEAAVPLEWARAFGMVMGLRHLMQLTARDKTLAADERNARLTAMAMERRQWALAAADLKINAFPKPVADRTPSLVSVAAAQEWM